MPPQIVNYIKQCIVQSGLSHYELCKQSGVDKAAMSRLINHNTLSLGVLDKLLEFFDLELTIQPK